MFFSGFWDVLFAFLGPPLASPPRFLRNGKPPSNAPQIAKRGSKCWPPSALALTPGATYTTYNISLCVIKCWKMDLLLNVVISFLAILSITMLKVLVGPMIEICFNDTAGVSNGQSAGFRGVRPPRWGAPCFLHWQSS